jgi:hypothetical protein
MRYDQYEVVKDVGVDETHGRFGAVDIWQCKTCGRLWVHYHVEYEAFTASGRYFMGLITVEKAQIIKPDQVVDYLDQLDWHLYGGSYFGSKGRSSGKVYADL